MADTVKLNAQMIDVLAALRDRLHTGELADSVLIRQDSTTVTATIYDDDGLPVERFDLLRIELIYEGDPWPRQLGLTKRERRRGRLLT